MRRSGCRRCRKGGRQHRWRRYPRVARGSRAVEEPWHARNLDAREPEGPALARRVDHRAGGCGDGGGKGVGRGEHGQFDTPRTQRRAWRVKRAGPCARGGTEGQGSTVHCIAAPRRPAWALGGRPGEPFSSGLHTEAGRAAAPLGIATLEDKVVQRAVVEVLGAVYEEDFLGFSYGFRPGRKPTMRWMRWRSGSWGRR